MSAELCAALRNACAALTGLMDLVAGDPEHDSTAMLFAEAARRAGIEALDKAEGRS